MPKSYLRVFNPAFMQYFEAFEMCKRVKYGEAVHKTYDTLTRLPRREHPQATDEVISKSYSHLFYRWHSSIEQKAFMYSTHECFITFVSEDGTMAENLYSTFFQKDEKLCI